jgi:hypothetical protein
MVKLFVGFCDHRDHSVTVYSVAFWPFMFVKGKCVSSGIDSFCLIGAVWSSITERDQAHVWEQQMSVLFPYCSDVALFPIHQTFILLLLYALRIELN